MKQGKLGQALKLLTSVLIIASTIYLTDMNLYAEEIVVPTTVETYNILHEHSGASNVSGGCYTVPIICGGTVQLHDELGPCNGVMRLSDYGTLVDIYGNPKSSQGYRKRICDKCGYEELNSIYGFGTDMGCTQQVNKTKYKCNLCGTTYESACTCNHITGYNLGCGLAAHEKIAEFRLNKSIGEQYILSIDTTILSPKCNVVSYLWNDSSTSTSLEVNADGEYSCRISYKDNGLLCSKTLNYTVTDFDRESPVINALTPNTTEMTSGNVTITISATDNVGVTMYSANGTTWQAANSFIVTQSKAYSFYAKDAAGNISDPVSITITNIDKELPVLTVNPVNTTWTKDNILLSYSATDNSAYTLNYQVSKIDSLTKNDILGTSTSYSITENGTYYVYAKDRAGNIAREEIIISNIDKQKPILTINPYTTDWISSPIPLSYHATDNSSSTITYAVSILANLTNIVNTETSYLITNNGTYYVYAKDEAGNIECIPIYISNIDTEAPIITPSSYNTNWTKGSIEIGFTATDNSNEEMRYSISTLDNISADNITDSASVKTISANGTYYFYAKDKAGNVSKTSITVTNIDNDAPVISLEPIPTEMRNTDISLSFSVSDNSNDTIYTLLSTENNLTDITGSITDYTISENGTYYVYAKDKAGNIAKQTITISCIDKEVPTLTIDPISSEWTSSSIQLTYSATDNSDGEILYAVSILANLTNIVNTETSYSITNNGTYYVYAKDEAGNITKQAITITNIDTEAPSITIDPVSAEMRNTDISLTFSVSDNSNDTIYTLVSKISNLTSINDTYRQYTISENGIYYVYAKDKAGNISFQTVTISTIDTTPPTASYVEVPGNSFISADGDTWHDTITVTVNASDNVALADAPYMFDDLYISENSKTYTANGTYSIKVKDAVGNVTDLPLIINTLDNTNPVITSMDKIYLDDQGHEEVIAANETEPEVARITIRVNANDNETGLHQSAYRYTDKNGVWSEWTDSNVLADIYFNGTYQIEVRDKCNNIESSSFTLTNLTEMVNVIYQDKSDKGDILGEKTEKRLIGIGVAGSELGILDETSAYYEGYDYYGCDTAIVTIDETIVHRYFKRHIYIVTFMDAEGQIVQKLNVPYGDSADIDELISKSATHDKLYKYEYEFIGWGDKNENLVDIEHITSNMNLYPVFKEIRTSNLFTVEFISNGITLSTQQVATGESAIAPQEPKMNGYNFTGWDQNFSNVTEDMFINATFEVIPVPEYVIKDEEVIVEDEDLYLIPSADKLESLGQDVEYIETQYKKEDNKDDSLDTEASTSTYKENEQLQAPLRSIADNVRSFYNDDKTKPLAVTTTTTIGSILLYAILSVLLNALFGMSLTQILIFTYSLIKKKVRYVQGAWLINTDGIKYVDKFGRKLVVTYNSKSRRYIFTRKGKVIDSVNVDDLIVKLNNGEITYEQFEQQIRSSKVYTSFSKDLEIETWNVKAINRQKSKMVSGYNLAKNIKDAFTNAGQYAVRLKNNGHEALIEIKYAMQTV